MARSIIYLDYAAATPLDPLVLATMQPYLMDKFYNPSAAYGQAQSVKNDLQAARARVAAVMGAKPSEIIFAAGGTEANNLAIKGIMSQYAGKKVLVSAIEHDAVLAPAAQFISAQIPVSEQGIINVIALQAMLDDDVVLVSCMYANNEVGTVQPIAEMSRVIAAERKRRRNLGNTTPIYFHTDACQASNYLNMQVSRLGVDLLTINGGKMYGPKQSGALFCKVGVPLQPIIVGGGQERGMRSGTENIANAVGLAHAFTQAQEMRRTEVGRLKTLQAEFLTRLAGAVPWAPVNGSRKHRLPNNVHVTIPGVDNESLLIQLEEKSILAAAGSACSASNGEPSHVLRAMGISDDAAKSSVRFTMGRHTTLEQVIATVDALALYC